MKSGAREDGLPSDQRAHPGLPRLSPATLGQAKAGCVLPGYDRASLRIGIVHLGLGAFARAHLATYTDDLLATDRGDWGIVGVSLQRPDQRDRLMPQSGLYTALQRDGGGAAARVIGCVRAVLVAPEDPAALLTVMAQDTCRIVSLTVTEKCYCHDPAIGRLDHRHPDIRHDLEHPLTPRSAIGVIFAALRHRLAAWIETECAFPSTMVDRIVPATTEADMAASVEMTGLFDAAPVSHEPFRQWVIEDRFIARTRPAWDKVGAQLVADVAPYEHMKLRLLNGAHSALAYLGYLAGHETIADTVADAVFRDYVVALWRQEIIPSVPSPPGTDLQGYAADLLTRFANPAIRHRTWQIAMDGSQKLPQRLLSTMRERLAQGLPFPRLALAVAAWVRYVGGIDEAGRTIDVRDPLAATLQATLAAAGPDPAARIAAVLGMQAVFGADLRRAAPFVAAITEAYAMLLAKGAPEAAALIPAD